MVSGARFECSNVIWVHVSRADSMFGWTGLADCILSIGLMPRQLILVSIQGTASIKVWSICTEVSQLGCIHGKSK